MQCGKTRSWRIFCGAAETDASFLDSFERHLASLIGAGRLKLGTERDILPGDRTGQVYDLLDNADIVVLLVSADLLSTRRDLIARTLARQNESIFPIRVRHVDLADDPLGKLTIWPTHGHAIASCDDPDAEWTVIAGEVRRLLERWEAAPGPSALQQGGRPPGPPGMGQVRHEGRLQRWLRWPALACAAAGVLGVVLYARSVLLGCDQMIYSLKEFCDEEHRQGGEQVSCALHKAAGKLGFVSALRRTLGLGQSDPRSDVIGLCQACEGKSLAACWNEASGLGKTLACQRYRSFCESGPRPGSCGRLRQKECLTPQQLRPLLEDLCMRRDRIEACWTLGNLIMSNGDVRASNPQDWQNFQEARGYLDKACRRITPLPSQCPVDLGLEVPPTGCDTSAVRACLSIADIHHRHLSDGNGNRQDAARYYKMVCDNGGPTFDQSCDDLKEVTTSP